MRDTAAALAWIVALLIARGVPFQVVGGGKWNGWWKRTVEGPEQARAELLLGHPHPLDQRWAVQAFARQAGFLGGGRGEPRLADQRAEGALSVKSALAGARRGDCGIDRQI